MENLILGGKKSFSFLGKNVFFFQTENLWLEWQEAVIQNRLYFLQVPFTWMISMGRRMKNCVCAFNDHLLIIILLEHRIMLALLQQVPWQLSWNRPTKNLQCLHAGIGNRVWGQIWWLEQSHVGESGCTPCRGRPAPRVQVCPCLDCWSHSLSLKTEQITAYMSTLFVIFAICEWFKDLVNESKECGDCTLDQQIQNKQK